MPIFYIFDNQKPNKENQITPTHIYKDLDTGFKETMLMGSFLKYRIYKVNREKVPAGQAFELKSTDEVAFIDIDNNKVKFRTIEKISEDLSAQIDKEVPEINTEEEQSYVTRLHQFFLYNSPIFFEQDESSQWRELKSLALDPAFMVLLHSHWSFSAVFLKNLVIDAQESVKKDLLKHQQFSAIIYLNELRKKLISKEEREDLTMAEQQQIVSQLLGRDAEGKINIPKELFNTTTGKIINGKDWIKFKEDCDEKYDRIKSQVTAAPSQAPGWSNNNNNNSNSNAQQPSAEEKRLSRLYVMLSLPENRASTEQKSYIEKLNVCLSPNFFSKTPALQWEEIYGLRTSDPFLKILMGNWQLSSLFLQKLAQNAGEAAKTQLSTSRLRQILALNNLRRELIPQEHRTRLSQAEQQLIVISALARQRNKAPQPQLVDMPNDNLRTVNINQRIDEGQIIIPDTSNIICPITFELLKNPVKVGVHYFTKEALINAVIATKGFNPLTREPLTVEKVRALPIDADKAKEVEDFKEQNRAMTLQSLRK
jgi:hypothetical protein